MTQPSVLSADQLARQQALAPDRSFCVLAPAGSGKTELLTQRLLKLLSVCDQPEHILAITFTRKAAGEMQHRLLASLRAAQASSISADAALSPHERTTRQLAHAALAQDNRQGWNLLQNPERLRLTTIDSFTSYLTSRLPFATNFGARPELTTDTTELFTQAVHATLANLDEDTPLGNALALLLPHLHNSHTTAEALLLDLLKKRADWLPVLMPVTRDPALARQKLEANMLSLLQEQLTGVRTELLPFQPTLMELVQFVAPYLHAQGDESLDALASTGALPGTNADAVLHWQALAALFLTDKGTFRKSLTKKQGFPPKDACRDKEEYARSQSNKDCFLRLTDEMTLAGTLPAWQALTILPPALYGPASWPVLTALLTILPALAAQLQVAMQGAGKIDHVETSLAALRALGNDDEPTDLALRLDYQLHHILVDEFQDTSWTQFNLLEKLTAGWQNGDGRTLFIVGDGMQSCYGFRNADVSLFLRARDSGIGPVKLEPLQLSVNFRSDAAVVGWVNEVFAHAFPGHDDVLRGGVSYSASEASKSTSTPAGVKCHLFTAETALQDDGTDDDDSTDELSTVVAGSQQLRQCEATHVAKQCWQLHKKHPADTIAILVRNRSHLAHVVQALRQHDIRWNASEIDRLQSYQDIMDLFSLLRALLNTADVTAWFALLRSPLVGLALADLETLALAARQQQQSLWTVLEHSSSLALGIDASQRLQRVVPVLKRARDSRQQLALRNLLELAWLDLGGAAIVSDHALLPNIVRFFDLVEEYAEHDDLADIHAFASRLSSSYGSAADPAVKLEIMTIHKAKGLQFDHVVLCGLDQKSRNDTAPLLRWQNFPDEHGRARLLLGVKQQKGGEADALHDFLGAQDKVRAGYELTRLLYIGVTRAIKTAWLYGVVKTDKKGEPLNPDNTLLGTVLPVLRADREKLNLKIETIASAAVIQSRTLPQQTLQRLPANWTSPLPSALLDIQPVEAETDIDDHDNLQARTFGELVHFGLKQLVQQGPQWLQYCDALPLWRQQLARVAGADELDALLLQVQQHLHGHEQSPQGRWLFSGDHRQDQCELALLDYRSGYRKSFVIDRTFIDSTGVRWIIDYKTASPATGQSLAAFIDDQAQRYREQLDNYRQLLAAADTATPCKTGLYFTAFGLLHELP